MRSGKGRILYYVFDVLYAGGHDLRALPLKRRRAILEKLLPVSETVRLSEAIETSGQAFFRAAEKNGLEGIMAKDLNSPYRSGARTRDWLKIKTQKRQEAVICGFTRPRASRKYFGALILGAFRKGKLVYIGHVGTGFTERTLKDIHAKLEPLVDAAVPVRRGAADEHAGDVGRAAPDLRGQVQRMDRRGAHAPPRLPGPQGGQERPGGRSRKRPSPGKAVLQKTKFRTRAELTHLDKVFWPGEGYTKGDLVEYYWRVAEWILPYLKDRPQALNRHPDGIAGESFFQKNLVQTPPAVGEDRASSPPKARTKTIRYLVCQNRDTLLYEANLGCIEINVWSSSIPHLDSPDYIVLDFDPLETSFSSVVEAVLAAKDFLDEMAMPGVLQDVRGHGPARLYPPGAPLQPRAGQGAGPSRAVSSSTAGTRT